MKKIYTFALLFAACALVACGGSQPKSADSKCQEEYEPLIEEAEAEIEELTN